MMTEWEILFHPQFFAEMMDMDYAVVNKITSAYKTLKVKGPLLKRPYADTLQAGEVKNLKELRLNVDGVAWRVAYYFNQNRQGILLCAGKKSDKLLYRKLIATAKRRMTDGKTPIHIGGCIF
ncbi:MAG: type II toxin-antitoxin system RelE/ParE family toxin [Proteobacteria bacterium]|nr:type II toxin-antitoxin system RelE/ParE family toxin [Pseudomonadota bacterium]